MQISCPSLRSPLISMKILLCFEHSNPISWSTLLSPLWSHPVFFSSPNLRSACPKWLSLWTPVHTDSSLPLSACSWSLRRTQNVLKIHRAPKTLHYLARLSPEHSIWVAMLSKKDKQVYSLLVSGLGVEDSWDAGDYHHDASRRWKVTRNKKKHRHAQRYNCLFTQ